MARRPRPTYRQLESLQRRYDAVVATLHRVHGEREHLKTQLEIANSNIVAIQKREAEAINQREFYIAKVDELNRRRSNRMWNRFLDLWGGRPEGEYDGSRPG